MIFLILGIIFLILRNKYLILENNCLILQSQLLMLTNQTLGRDCANSLRYRNVGPRLVFRAIAFYERNNVEEFLGFFNPRLQPVVQTVCGMRQEVN